jgi:hypothetical protein
MKELKARLRKKMRVTPGHIKIRLLNAGNPVTFLRIDSRQEHSCPERSITPETASSQ